jgi:hypothetical protein
VRTPYWTPNVTDADLERVNEKLVKLGFLSSAVDLDAVILKTDG